jgi:hypothetical protein
MLPIGSRRRQLLYQSTYFSGAPDGFHAPPGATSPDHLDLEQADDGFRERIVIADVTDGGLVAGLEEAVPCIAWTRVARPCRHGDATVLQQATVMLRLLEGIRDEAGMCRSRCPPTGDMAGKGASD